MLHLQLLQLLLLLLLLLLLPLLLFLCLLLLVIVLLLVLVIVLLLEMVLVLNDTRSKRWLYKLRHILSLRLSREFRVRPEGYPIHQLGSRKL